MERRHWCQTTRVGLPNSIKPSKDEPRWLKAELQCARKQKERVIIGCHHPFGQNSARETHMAWNAPLIESLVIESGVVALVMSGHDHVGGYCQIENTHFLTLPGVVESTSIEKHSFQRGLTAPAEFDAYGFVHIEEDLIKIEGRGVVQDRVLRLK